MASINDGSEHQTSEEADPLWVVTKILLCCIFPGVLPGPADEGISGNISLSYRMGWQEEMLMKRGRDAHEKRNRKMRGRGRLGQIEGISVTCSRKRNVLPRLKQLRTQRPQSPEQQDEIAMYRAGTTGEQSSNQNNTRVFWNHIPSPTPDYWMRIPGPADHGWF